MSYNGRDVDRVKPLAAALASQGWQVFYDRTIPPGKTWRQFIGKEIDGCRCMVVAWSKHSINSHWVCEEADIGLKRRILVPLFLDRVDPPLGFRSIQAADLVDWQEDQDAPGFYALCQAIVEIIGPGTVDTSHERIEKNRSDISTTEKAKIQKMDQRTEKENSPKDSKNEKVPSSDAEAKNRSPIIDWLKQRIHRPKYDAVKILLITIVPIALLIWSVVISQKQQAILDVPPRKSKTETESAATKQQTESEPLIDSKTNQQPKIKEPEMAEIPAGNVQTGRKDGSKGEQPIVVSQKQQAILDVPSRKSKTETESAETKRQKELSSMVSSKTSQHHNIKEPEMVEILAGNFEMGSENGDKDEQPVHNVKVNRFAIGRYEVTFDEYDRYAEAMGKPKPVDLGWGRGPRPAVAVSWHDAQAYADWLSENTGKHYRLPTEAEWEYATGAGTREDYYWGDQGKMEDFAWFEANSDGKTHPVGQKRPNAFGLYDMSGNVWEWVQDCWHENYRNAPTDSSAWEEQNGGNCNYRVTRGGSWNFGPAFLRAAFRGARYPGSRNGNLGFRLAQDLP